MNAVIRSRATVSLCPTCYRELPARLEYRDDGAAWLTKECPAHGRFEAMTERSWLFWEACQQRRQDDITHQRYNGISLIEVTDRCNVNCAHCYHNPDNKAVDRPAEWIVAKALAVPTSTVCLMGAEPTMRDDLPEIVAAIAAGGKAPTIYTNGVKLREPGYAQRLKQAGLAVCSVSVHHPQYHTKKVFDWVLEGLGNVVEAGIPLGQISFTVTNVEEVDRALGAATAIVRLGARPVDFCIRSPAEIGKAFHQDHEIFPSEIFAWMQECAGNVGIDCHLHEHYGSNPYHVGVLVAGIPCQVIHWPTAASIDMSFMNMGPWAAFIDGTFGSFVIQAILRDGMKKGWWQGKRLVPEEWTKALPPVLEPVPSAPDAVGEPVELVAAE